LSDEVGKVINIVVDIDNVSTDIKEITTATASQNIGSKQNFEAMKSVTNQASIATSATEEQAIGVEELLYK